MTTARELMTRGAECVAATPSSPQLSGCAQLDVGAMPICGDDDRLARMITDRDIVVKCIADGVDPSSAEVGRVRRGQPVTISADDDIEEALRTMTQYDVHRSPSSTATASSGCSARPTSP